jgi:preprotein translocase subunit SecF
MKPCLIFSLAIMLIALVMTLTGHGLNLGVDFTGGTLMTYNMGSEFDTNDISAVLTANGITDAQIAKVGQDNEVQIRISDKDNTDSLRSELEKSLSEKYPNIRYVDLSRVGAVAGRDLINNAIKSVLVASVLMLLYIAIRFDFNSGLSAVFGLLHDVLMMLSFMVIFRSFIQMNSSFIAAALTIVGYSINNTIVIFDRIRENHKKMPTAPKEEVTNISIKESLGRTICTTLTTLITIVALCILGVASIREFALPIIIGILSGVYSANMINGYVWAFLEEKRRGRKAKA